MSIRELSPWNRRRKASLKDSDYHTIQAMYERMGRLFDDFVTHFGVTPFGQGIQGSAFLLPRIDVLERDKECWITVELPGVDEEDVNVTLSDRTLNHRGREKNPKPLREGIIFSVQSAITAPLNVPSRYRRKLTRRRSGPPLTRAYSPRQWRRTQQKRLRLSEST